MKAKHHFRKGRSLMYPGKPPGPQNPWVDTPIQRPRPLEHLYPATDLKNMRLHVAMQNVFREMSK